MKSTDFNLPGHTLADSVEPRLARPLQRPGAAPATPNCNPDPPDVGAASQSVITQFTSTTATTIHNATHDAVTTVPEGSIVHDFVTVTGVAGKPVPTGTVKIDWFTNSDCTGNPATTSAAIALVPNADNAHGRRDELPAGPARAGELRLQGALPGRPGEPGLHGVRRAL